LINNKKSGIERLYKNPKSPENTPKNAKEQQSTETKRMVNTKSGGSGMAGMARAIPTKTLVWPGQININTRK